MIRTHSDDPDVAAAAREAADIVARVLRELPKAETFDYGGHDLHVGEYDVCIRCTGPIAEAQAGEGAIRDAMHQVEDPEVREHLELAAQLLRMESEAAVIRAELHNGQDSERIVNELLAFISQRQIGDSYDHTHHGGNA
jgi:hypothetical protein